MALTKPILLKVPAFDASNNNVFKFEVYGGDQIVGNTLKITDNETGTVVYNSFQNSYVPKHVLPTSVLKNGTYYSASIQTKNSNGETSVWSNIIDFYCYTTPTIEITNIPIDEIVRSFSFRFEIKYNQIEKEPLNSYKFILYDSSKIKIFSTDILYVGEITELPLFLYYTFSGLETNEIYEAEIIGETINDTIIKSPRYRFKVNYIQPESYALLYLNNNCEGGYIDIESNIIDMSGKTPFDPVYIDGQMLDIRDSYVYWDEGFHLNSDFVLRVWGSNFEKNERILKMKHSQFTENIDLYYRQDEDKYIIEAYVYDNEKTPMCYYIYSNAINVIDGEQIFIWLKRINGIYELKIENRGVV